MRRSTCLRPLLFIVVVMFCMAPFTIGARAEKWSWTKVASDSDLTFVDMVNSTYGWAVGYDGAMSNWDGKRWYKIAGPTTANLKAVNVISSTEVWAIAGNIRGWGNNNSIIRWDGTKWMNLSEPSPLEAIRMISSTGGWAVGPAGTALHWDGTSWTRIEIPVNVPLESVDFDGSVDGWAVGRRAQSGINCARSASAVDDQRRAHHAMAGATAMMRLKTGRDLRRLRRRLGLSQPEFARQLGFAAGDSGQVHISRLENDRYHLTRPVVIIARHIEAHGILPHVVLAQLDRDGTTEER